MRNWFFEQIAMYSAYHRNGHNQLTHHVGVPMIVFSLMVLTSTVEIVQLPFAPISLATLLIAVLVLMYISIVPLTGLIAAVLYGALLYLAGEIAAQGFETALTVFLTLFIVGWIIQFVGHVFEKRKPALFDNILQIFMAPSFLIAEILFMFGLESGLKKEIEARIHTYLPAEAKKAA